MLSTAINSFFSAEYVLQRLVSCIFFWCNWHQSLSTFASNLAISCSRDTFFSATSWSRILICMIWSTILVSCFSYLSKWLTFNLWQEFIEDDTPFRDTMAGFCSGDDNILVFLQFKIKRFNSPFDRYILIQLFIFKVLLKLCFCRRKNITFGCINRKRMLSTIL